MTSLSCATLCEISSLKDYVMDIRKQFTAETDDASFMTCHMQYDSSECVPTLKYVEWLESKLETIAQQPTDAKSCAGCWYDTTLGCVHDGDCVGCSSWTEHA